MTMYRPPQVRLNPQIGMNNRCALRNLNAIETKSTDIKGLHISRIISGIEILITDILTCTCPGITIIISISNVNPIAPSWTEPRNRCG
jgi:hypothetical protein